MSERWYVLPSAAHSGQNGILGYAQGARGIASQPFGAERTDQGSNNETRTEDEMLERAEAVFVLPPPCNDS